MLTELFIAVGLWRRGTRCAAVWIAVVFHVAIEVSASVQVFSYLAIAVLVIWAVPSTRDRILRIDPTASRPAAPGRAGAPARLARTVSRRAGAAGRAAELVDRDGTTFHGAPAVAFVLSRLPLTAWFALPLLLLPRAASRALPAGVRQQGDF